jgi:hypothetical protein
MKVIHQYQNNETHTNPYIDITCLSLVPNAKTKAKKKI